MNPKNGKNWTFRRRLKNQKVINRGALKNISLRKAVWKQQKIKNM